jgi:hypothetical protein
MKIEIISFLIVISVLECGIIYRSLGDSMAEWFRLLRWQGGGSSILFSLKW